MLGAFAMSDSSDNSNDLSNSSSGTLLTEVIKGLQKQPVLLYTLGIAIVLSGAATLTLENFRIFSGTLLILSIAGLAAWIFLEAHKLQQAVNRTPKSDQKTTGSIQVDRSTVEDVRGGTGNIAGSDSSGVQSKTGDIKISKSSVKQSTLKTGKIDNRK
jgi:hypothetical protein